MLLLTSTNDILELVTSSTSNIDYLISWADITTTTFTPGSSQGTISTATTTTILSAPGSSTQRQVKMISISNRGTSTQSLTLQKDVSGTDYEILPVIALQPNESLHYVDGYGFSTIDNAGRIKTSYSQLSGTTGRGINFYKVGTAREAAGVMHSYHAATGLPGAFAPGTPGLGGRTTDGTTSTDAGCVPIWTPTGSLFLTGFDANASLASQLILFDLLWINTGAVVTTTTGQTVNSGTLPARDLNGTTSGEGVNAAILVTTATTNAGAVTNTTLTYTNSDGTGSRTATISSFPATAVAGTFVPFQLAAGDKGIQSIQTLTLGTSYGGGAISIVLYRDLSSSSIPTANVGGYSALSQAAASPGVRLYNGSCMLLRDVAGATTATNISGVITIMER